MRWSAVAVVLLCVAPLAGGDGEKQAPAPMEDKAVTELAEQARKSIAVLLYTGRDGKQIGLGTGFVVAAGGLIATNLHVIGEGRTITVRLPDGKSCEATEVHASDRKLDLAIVRVAVKGLTPLPLGDDKALKPGQPLVVLGHPRGLEHSVVAGVLSGRREVDGLAMLQLAIPIEEGNSGGPVLDRQGRVVGVVTMRSAVTNNLGFAVPIGALRPLIDRPNPVPIDQWLTIGALDKAEWQVLFGGRWRQRAGRIIADGIGTGFGGRTVCLSQRKVPAVPFELTVTVKLDDESGAAGLIFGGDGGGRHYGFYPSGGKLRLTRFDGPDVYSWKVLKELPHAAYRPGTWNTLHVRIEKDRALCRVNGQLVTELTDPKFYGSAVGLAKFRQTVAEFKQFQVDKAAGPAVPGPEIRAALEKAITHLPAGKPPATGDLQVLLKHPNEGTALLRDRARALEEQAARLRGAADALHHQRCLEELTRLLKAPDKELDLLRGALLVARLDNEELDIESYLQEVGRMAKQVADKAAPDAAPTDRLATLVRFLFKERGFHGSRTEYYARANSYLNEVIDDREGLPLTLSVLFLELARRLDIPVVGVGLPGHFVVRFEPPGGPAQLIDVFEGGKFITEEDAAKKVLDITGEAARPANFDAVSKKAIITRLVRNLVGAAQREKDGPGMLRYLDAILAIDSDAHAERWGRALLRFQAGQRDGARADCDYLLEREPADIDIDRVRDLYRILKSPENAK
jgi:regulator of sirC expression with transglutaminase-like and TPR domain